MCLFEGLKNVISKVALQGRNGTESKTDERIREFPHIITSLSRTLVPRDAEISTNKCSRSNKETPPRK